MTPVWKFFFCRYTLFRVEVQFSDSPVGGNISSEPIIMLLEVAIKHPNDNATALYVAVATTFFTV